MSSSEKENRIIEEYQQLTEKSNNLFNGLRDIPNHSLKQWQPYFVRTFDCYSKLWKLQQVHRNVLRDRYGLKRWEIGEIASKIGQLYYHYYLKTSETSYLCESFSFYAAVRERGYFNKIGEEKRPELIVKRLRYYARFLVTCMLMLKKDLLAILQEEFVASIDDYVQSYHPPDGSDWQMVAKELAMFLEADSGLSVPGMTLSFRMRERDNLAVDIIDTNELLTLKEAVVIGCKVTQGKFSELTLDMSRVLQTLEIEPELINESKAGSKLGAPAPAPPLPVQPAPVVVISQPLPASAAPAPLGPSGLRTEPMLIKRSNPHKHLLYKPTIPHLLLTLASAVKDLDASKALLLYVSANGIGPMAQETGTTELYSRGGIPLIRKQSHNDESLTVELPDQCLLYPHDLLPFTRTPLIIIIDSNHSSIFKDLPSPFGQPVICLLSPTSLPLTLKDSTRLGSLFTTFLHSPIKALSFITGLLQVPQEVYVKCDDLVIKFYGQVARLFGSQKCTHIYYRRFLGDEFVRLLIFRFVFCCVALRLAKAFQHNDKTKRLEFMPSSSPAMPENIVRHPSLEVLMLEIAKTLDVYGQFVDK